MLLVRGNIIYQGEAAKAIDYFASIGYKCPMFSNPSDYFMKLMNEEGLLVEKIQAGEADDFDDKQIQEEFESRLNLYIDKYSTSAMMVGLDPIENTVIRENDADFHIGFFT